MTPVSVESDVEVVDLDEETSWSALPTGEVGW